MQITADKYTATNFGTAESARLTPQNVITTAKNSYNS
jgi:hypothetical protein